MTKVVLKLYLHEDKMKQKAMKTVCGIHGVDSLAMNMKDKKLTVTGDVDAVDTANKLRKLCHTEIVSVEQVKEPEKKKNEPKKDDQNKPQEQKKNSKDGKNNPDMTSYYYGRSAEEDPNACCVIS